MGNHVEPIVELLNVFIKLRQSGVARDDAWHTVLDRCDGFKETDIQRLLYLAKDWEKREGYKYRNRVLPDVDPKETIIRPLSPYQNPPQQQEPQQPQQPQTPPRQEPPREKPKATTMLDPKVLAQIEATAGKGEVIKPLEELVSGKTSQLRSQDKVQPLTYFGANSKIIMYFKDFPDDVLTIEVPHDYDLVIGRLAPNSVMTPDIDLTPVHAGHYGVSRMHASLRREENTVLLSDLGSANHTYLNGKRLLPHEWRVLKHDDQITFADLLTQIRFSHS